MRASDPVNSTTQTQYSYQLKIARSRRKQKTSVCHLSLCLVAFQDAPGQKWGLTQTTMMPEPDMSAPTASETSNFGAKDNLLHFSAKGILIGVLDSRIELHCDEKNDLL